MNIKNIGLNVNSVSFSGHSKFLDKKGNVQHSFFYLFNPQKYKCEVELYNIDDDDKGNISIMEDKPAYTFDLPEKGRKLAIPKEIYTKKRLGFAYRFKLTDKTTNKVSYAFDNGDVIGIKDTDKADNKYNIVFSNRAVINKNGPMQLIMPDEYYPGIEKGSEGAAELIPGLRAKALAGVRTHANKLGGKFYGIISRLPEIKKEGIARIVGMPYTKDNISSHKYWTENAYQISPDFGSEEDFKTFQNKLFAAGINWVADAALVNEGLGGIHVDAMLRKGNDSYAGSMFRHSEQIALGILPAADSNDAGAASEHTKMKIINPPFIFKGGKMESNPDYKSRKPVFIQFYDDRLASERQIQSESPSDLRTYAKMNTDNIYDITKHDDAVYPFVLEVNPELLIRNVKKTLEGRNIKNYDIKRIPSEDIPYITNFPNFKAETKNKKGGLELWDGNADIAKLNFYLNPSDYDGLNKNQAVKLERGSLAVRDYALNSGRYWTQLTADSQIEYIVSKLNGCAGNADEYKKLISQLIKKGEFPDKAAEIDKETIENVLNGSYSLRKLKKADERDILNPEAEKCFQNGSALNDYTLDDYIFKKAADTPLETLHFANNLMSIISSPYITFRPVSEDELGLSKYDLARIRQKNPDTICGNTLSKMTDVYESGIAPLIKDITSNIPGISEHGKVSEYGRYVLSEIVPDLTKYILTKAIAPDADIKVSNDGHFDFSSVKEEDITMQSIGIPYSGVNTDEDEAQIVINRMKKGIRSIPEKEIQILKKAIETRFKNRKLKDYKIAEMIHDRTESGLGWRIDAAKDIVSVDAVRSKLYSADDAWDSVIGFWKLFNQTALKENPHAYTTAEITDLDQMFSYNDKAKYISDADAERKFIEQTGITSTANYNYFFSLLPAMYTKFSPETGNRCNLGWDGWMSEESKNFPLRQKLIEGWNWGDKPNNPGFLYQSPEDGVTNSYTFIGNHDKPRIIHTLALDMNLFHGELQSKEHQDIAKEVLLDNNIDLSRIDSKAIAMGYRINQAIDALKFDDELALYLKIAVSSLAKGSYKGKSFPCEAFGTRPFETAIKTVLDEAEYQLGSPIKNRKDIELKLLKNIIEPALEKFLHIYKLLIVLPGSPADFAGDRLGVSGYESKAKNYHQQNRNVIPWEYLAPENEEKYSFIKNFYNKMNEIANLRNKKELSALNNGASVSIPVSASFTYKDKDENGKEIVKKETGTAEKLQALLRYNDEGSVVLSLISNAGAGVSNTEKLDKNKIIHYDSIELEPDGGGVKSGLRHWFKDGLKFKDAESNDEYVIRQAEKDGRVYYRLEPAVKVNSAGAAKDKIKIRSDAANALVLYQVKN